MKRTSILGVKINNLKFTEVEEILLDTLAKGKKKSVFTPNTEIIMMCQEDKDLLRVINSGDIVTPDGIGLIYASKIYRAGLKERVTGFDIS
ncbi:MAG TPA: glycosyltransferase, partial [Clostridiales bacterium]|nr:glycosyltransferase [Clostridiales bacterium]